VNEPRSESPPIPEARPPHLPDVVTRLSPGFFAFALVAVLVAWLSVREWIGLYPFVDTGAVIALLATVQFVVVPLLGAALFLRHPQAHRTLPLLAFGLALMTFGEVLSAFDDPIRRFLAELSPSDVGPTTPATLAYAVFTSLLALFALLYVGAGLTAARRRDRGAAERPLAIWLGALAVVGAVISLATVFQLQFDASAAGIVQLVIGFVLSLLLTLAWAYVTAVAIGGWLTREDPRRAWILAALGLSILFAVRLIASTVTALFLGDAFLTLLTVTTIASAAAWLLLLVAFALGLPGSSDSGSGLDGVGEREPTADPPAATPPGSAAG
jgi:hypothetical protein